jgi:RNA polymerase sigma-70 factor (ECF subfamily)
LTDFTDLEDAAKRVSSGDLSAFERIVAATSTSLVRLGARILGNPADAEDVVQEAYVNAYRALRDGRFDGRSSIRTWLFRIVTNASLTALRGRARRPVPIDTADDVLADGRLGSPEAVVALSELSTLLSELPDDQRAAIVLKVVEGLSSAEVAEILQCTEGAVEQRLVRARATLRKRSGS